MNRPGYGALNPERQAEAIAMLRAGMRNSVVAQHFGVTKHVIAGLKARHVNPPAPGTKSSTLFERCDALNATMDQVLRETRRIGIAELEP